MKNLLITVNGQESKFIIDYKTLRDICFLISAYKLDFSFEIVGFSMLAPAPSKTRLGIAIHNMSLDTYLDPFWSENKRPVDQTINYLKHGIERHSISPEHGER